MKSFDEYYSNSEWYGTYQSDLMMREAFEAGQQSKQAEVDELRKRVDDAIYDLQHIESVMWEEQVGHILITLKGESNDH